MLRTETVGTSPVAAQGVVCSALLTLRFPSAGLVTLAVRRFGKNRGAETRLDAGNRPEGTRHRHGKEPAGRSRLFDSGRSEGVKEEGRCWREPPESVRCMQYRISGTPRVTPCTQRTAPVGRAQIASSGTFPGFFPNRPRIVLESSSTPSRIRTG